MWLRYSFGSVRVSTINHVPPEDGGKLQGNERYVGRKRPGIVILLLRFERTEFTASSKPPHLIKLYASPTTQVVGGFTGDPL